LCPQVQSQVAVETDRGASLFPPGDVRPESRTKCSRPGTPSTTHGCEIRISSDFAINALGLVFLTALYPVNVRPLFGFSFADVGRFTGHVAWVKMELSRFLFTRLLLVWIPVVGHGTLLLTLTITASNEPGSFSALLIGSNVVRNYFGRLSQTSLLSNCTTGFRLNADELGRRLRARATIEPVAAKDK
jgi:hypothetical protein